MMNKLTLAVIAALSGGMIAATVLADTPPAYHPDAKENQSAKHALDRRLPKIDFNAVTLSDALDFLSNTTEANISVDWKELEKASIAKDTPITMKLSAEQPLHTVLNLMLRQAGGTGVLTYYIDDGIIQITTSEAADKELVSKVYPIQDLLFQPTDYTNAPDLSLQSATQGSQGGGGAGGGGGSSNQTSIFSNSSSSSSSSTSSASDQKTRADEIIKLITDTVKPELWQINGGTATITFYRGNLIVNAPRSIHDMLESH
jgi:hypothetical protein